MYYSDQCRIFNHKFYRTYRNIRYVVAPLSKEIVWVSCNVRVTFYVLRVIVGIMGQQASTQQASAQQKEATNQVNHNRNTLLDIQNTSSLDIGVWWWSWAGVVALVAPLRPVITNRE